MIQLVPAYATLARGGFAVEPYAIRKITSKESGEIIYKYNKPAKPRRVVEVAEISQINQMMRSVIEKGSGTAASIPYPAAGKTGTTQDYRDAWFVGFTQRYTGAIWLGNDDNSPMNRMSGGSAPARIWRSVMLTAQTRGGKAYDSFPVVTLKNQDSFDGLIDGIVDGGGAEGDGWFNGLFDGFTPVSYTHLTLPTICSV